MMDVIEMDVTEMSTTAMESEYKHKLRKYYQIGETLSRPVSQGGYHPSKQAEARTELARLESRLRDLNAELYKRER